MAGDKIPYVEAIFNAIETKVVCDRSQETTVLWKTGDRMQIIENISEVLEIFYIVIQ